VPSGAQRRPPFQQHSLIAADLGAVAVKSIAAPVPAWQVLCPSGVASWFEALRGTALTTLVDEELASLQRRREQAKAGEGCVVLVSGEPGIGKSRLAQTLLDHSFVHRRVG